MSACNPTGAVVRRGVAKGERSAWEAPEGISLETSPAGAPDERKPGAETTVG